MLIALNELEKEEEEEDKEQYNQYNTVNTKKHYVVIQEKISTKDPYPLSYVSG